jgi:hypothetical protein
VILAASAAAVAVTFGQAAAVPGDDVTVRATGLRSSQPVYLYLVARADRAKIRSAFDRSLVFVTRLRPRAGRATAMFEVPAIASGTYVAWCRGCRARTAAPLRITMPIATVDACPVTVPTNRPHGVMGGFRYGNGALSAGLPLDGVLRLDQPTKLGWSASGVQGPLWVSGWKLDPPSARLVVHGVNRGTDGRSWAAPVTFPTPGCWTVLARLEDYYLGLAVTLSYVVKVERA